MFAEAECQEWRSDQIRGGRRTARCSMEAEGIALVKGGGTGNKLTSTDI